MSQGAWRAKGQLKDRPQGGAAPDQEGASRVVATLQYLGRGPPGSAEDSMAFGDTT